MPVGLDPLAGSIRSLLAGLISTDDIWGVEIDFDHLSAAGFSGALEPILIR
jgi:hypothetical protein